MNTQMTRLAVAVAVLGLGMTGCGGGSSQSPAPPVGGVPTPAPSPTPTPTPTPTATPGPTLVGAVPGQTLVGSEACSRSAATVDSRGHVTALPALSGAKIDNGLQLTFRASDSYALDLNGFGGPSYGPSDKQTSPNPVYDQFLNPGQGEFFLFRDGGQFGSRTFATTGLDNSGGGLCFFAVGLPTDSLPAGSSAEYLLLVDGVGQVSGQTRRLFGSTGKLVVNAQARTATIELQLLGRGNAFEDFTVQNATAITSATGSFTLSPDGVFSVSSLMGTNGYSGEVRGSLVSPASKNTFGGGGAGAVLTFELHNAQGDVLFGAIAADREQ